ncbi:MAG TPA: transglycosylase SLT domain-containing protein [Gemmatimonadaceae bacterium]|nr:transglycosylase SLT domain-containing protein [Gemmatimonadaceae bacterium]
MPTDERRPASTPPSRRPRRALREVATGLAALATVVGASWGTRQLPRPHPAVPFGPPAAASTTAAALPAPLAPVRIRPAALSPAALRPVASLPAATTPAVLTRAARLPVARPLLALTPVLPAVRVHTRAPVVVADSARTAPLERVLRKYSRDRKLVHRIAAAVLREARRAHVDPSLVVAVLVAENNTLRPRARNASTGAQGLMQVMPGWAGRLGCASRDLADVDANICHGVRVLAEHLKDAGGDLREGLRLYNGCRRTAGSRRCDAYPTRVLAHAERLEHQLAAGATSAPVQATHR